VFTGSLPNNRCPTVDSITKPLPSSVHMRHSIFCQISKMNNCHAENMFCSGFTVKSYGVNITWLIKFMLIFLFFASNQQLKQLSYNEWTAVANSACIPFSTCWQPSLHYLHRATLMVISCKTHLLCLKPLIISSLFTPSLQTNLIIMYCYTKYKYMQMLYCFLLTVANKQPPFHVPILHR
jgi:hypothetical protein